MVAAEDHLARRPICSGLARRVVEHPADRHARVGRCSARPPAAAGRRTPRASAQRNPPSAPSKRSRQSVSPVFVDVGTKASRRTALRIVHGTIISSTTASGIAAASARCASRHRGHQRPGEEGGDEPDRERADQHRHAEHGAEREEAPRRGQSADQSWVTTMARAARHQKMYIVSSCTRGDLEHDVGEHGEDRRAATSPPRSPNRRRADDVGEHDARRADDDVAAC